MSVDIVCPDGVKPHNVFAGSGYPPTGVICAHGDATIDRHFFQEIASRVEAKILQVFDQNDPTLYNPPSGTTVAHVDGFGKWRCENIPGAICGPDSAPRPNTLVVWFTFGTGSGSGVHVERRVRAFSGVCAPNTNCCEGSGSGAASLAQAGAVQTVALATAPVLWVLLAAGFEAGKALLNGPWALALRGAGNGFCAWDNGGDGARVPHVELRCESPLASTWRLTFRHGADTVSEYTRAAAEWNPLAPNVLHRSGNGATAGVAPAHLTITPG
ncbi:MAG: hypothetical protein JWO38_7023 [Gemmataceae bacterium]|nr:hypothetical protein [Gemmataceae bacterium]